MFLRVADFGVDVLNVDVMASSRRSIHTSTPYAFFSNSGVLKITLAKHILSTNWLQSSVLLLLSWKSDIN